MTAALIQTPQLPVQPVEVFANGKKIADWQVGNTAQFSAVVPAEALKPGENLEIEFKTPKELGQREDPRVLGICRRNIQLFVGS
jgi:hypothetical protein